MGGYKNSEIQTNNYISSYLHAKLNIPRRTLSLQEKKDIERGTVSTNTRKYQKKRIKGKQQTRASHPHTYAHTYN